MGGRSRLQGLVLVPGVVHCHACSMSSAGVDWKGQKGKLGEEATQRKLFTLAFLSLGIRTGKGKSWEVASNCYGDNWGGQRGKPAEGRLHIPILSDSRRGPAALSPHCCRLCYHHRVLHTEQSSQMSSCRWQAAVVLLDICSEQSPFQRCRIQLIISPHPSPLHSPQQGCWASTCHRGTILYWQMVNKWVERTGDPTYFRDVSWKTFEKSIYQLRLEIHPPSKTPSSRCYPFAGHNFILTSPSPSTYKMWPILAKLPS